MVFVRRLVCREARIAIEAISAVFYLYVGYLLIESHDALDSLLHPTFELSLYSLIIFLMFLEPLTVVIGHHLPQELQNALLIHSLYI